MIIKTILLSPWHLFLLLLLFCLLLQEIHINRSLLFLFFSIKSGMATKALKPRAKQLRLQEGAATHSPQCDMKAMGKGRTSKRAAHLIDPRLRGSHGLGGNTPQGTQNKRPSEQLPSAHLCFYMPFRASELGYDQRGLKGSIPCGTLFERHWRRFPHATEIPACSTRGLWL